MKNDKNDKYTNENETVAEIVKRVRRECNSYPLPTAAAEMLKLVREVDAAHKREMADEKRISDAVIQSLREKKLEMAGEIVEKDAEIVRLRALVSELLNKLVINHCIGCQVDDCDMCVYYAQNEAVAAKAREVIGGAE